MKLRCLACGTLYNLPPEGGAQCPECGDCGWESVDGRVKAFRPEPVLHCVDCGVQVSVKSGYYFDGKEYHCTPCTIKMNKAMRRER